jgi:hypothetical protein
VGGLELEGMKKGRKGGRRGGRRKEIYAKFSARKGVVKFKKIRKFWKKHNSGKIFL